MSAAIRDAVAELVATTPVREFGKGAGDLGLPVLRAALAERWEADLAYTASPAEACRRAHARIRAWGGARR